MQEHTILGVKLRRLIISIVNGMGRGDHIRVQFRGTRAYTDGRNINLPAIRDLAEIPYGTARALIGYAIHEVAHIRYTDFEAIIRAIEAGKMEPDALVKKFENAIEDYRIERTIADELPGTASDLTALRNLIHPDLRKLSPQWLADPRACGPLALTWTGSVLNGFVIPAMQDTLDAFPAPVRALIDNWTARMKDVQSTEEVVDLAIIFTAEANAYADASRQQQSSSPDSEQDDESDVDQDDAVSTSTGADQSNDDADYDSQPANQESGRDETDDDHTGDDDTDADDASRNENAGNQTGSGPDTDTTSGQDDQDAADEANASSNGGGDVDQAAQQDPNMSDDDQATPGQEGQNSSEGDLDSANSTADAPAGDQSDTSQASADGSSAPDHSRKNSASSTGTRQPGEQSSSEEGVDDLNFGSEAPSDPSQSPDQSSSSGPLDNSGKVDFDNSITEPSSNAGGTSPQQSPGPDNTATSTDCDDAEASSENSDASTPSNCDGQNADASQQSNATSDPLSQESDGPDTESADDQSGEANIGDPLKDVLEDNAAFDDLMDDLRDYIAGNPLPDSAPEATDGEVDPEAVLEEIKEANSVAPNYTSPDPDTNTDEPGGNPQASKHHYADNRFVPIDASREEDNQYATLKSNAAGVINTTARTIRRLLMAEEQRGVLRGRRDGQFDIRNVSAIVRGTGNCYKRRWERPAPETHLTILTDFSGSMVYGSGQAEPRALAITGALAIEEATRGTQVETSIYGFQGWSPHVVLYPFKEGKQAATLTRRNIGAYRSLQLGCTPTGEAMAAMGEILDEIAGKRRILLVLTDGAADDTSLCKSVVPVLRRRGIEVVAIGIQCDAVTEWCEDSHVIHDINQLPQALLSTIDPRANKKLRKAA